jgi:hypothetical protein
LRLLKFGRVFEGGSLEGSDWLPKGFDSGAGVFEGGSLDVSDWLPKGFDSGAGVFEGGFLDVSDCPDNSGEEASLLKSHKEFTCFIVSMKERV